MLGLNFQFSDEGKCCSHRLREYNNKLISIQLKNVFFIKNHHLSIVIHLNIFFASMMSRDKM